MALNVTEASDGQGVDEIHPFRTVERGTTDWTGARLGLLGTNILAHPANKQFSCLQYVGILRTNRFSLDFFFKVIRSNVSQVGLKFTDLAEDDLELLLRLQTCTSTSSFVLCWGPNYILGPSPDLINLLSHLLSFPYLQAAGEGQGHPKLGAKALCTFLEAIKGVPGDPDAGIDRADKGYHPCISVPAFWRATVTVVLPGEAVKPMVEPRVGDQSLGFLGSSMGQFVSSGSQDQRQNGQGV